MNRIEILEQEWEDRFLQLLSFSDNYAPGENDFKCDYVKLEAPALPSIVYYCFWKCSFSDHRRKALDYHWNSTLC